MLRVVGRRKATHTTGGGQKCYSLLRESTLERATNSPYHRREGLISSKTKDHAMGNLTRTAHSHPQGGGTDLKSIRIKDHSIRNRSPS